eukprot:scaffold151588_cov10-Tisochrysis_lutea.AAC.1
MLARIKEYQNQRVPPRNAKAFQPAETRPISGPAMNPRMLDSVIFAGLTATPAGVLHAVDPVNYLNPENS